MSAEPPVTSGPPGELAGLRAGSGFAWSCHKAGNGKPAGSCDITSGDRAEYERHMRGHGCKPPKSAAGPWKPWRPPRPARTYAPKPMDPGQRAEWVKVTEGHHENPGYLAGDGSYVPPSGPWVPETRQVRTGVIWSVADTASAWWVQPDDDPAHPVYIKRAGKRDRWTCQEGELYELPGAGEAAHARASRAEAIRRRGIFPVIDNQSPAATPRGTSHIYLTWHCDPACPRAAGKQRYDPDRPPPGIVCGYQPQGTAVRPLAQPRWTVLDVADVLASGQQPPSCLCPHCITNLDPDRPATPGDHPTPGKEPDMSATRRPDGQPETPADTRFFDLRESGYTGPIDQDGYPVTDDWMTDTASGQTYSTYSAHPGLLASAGEEHRQWRQQMRGQHATSRMHCPPGSAMRVTPRLMTGLEPPATDAEFLDTCTTLTAVLLNMADQVDAWAAGLATLHFPPPVLASLADVSGCLSAGAINALHAARAFRDHYQDARTVATSGLRITGAGST